MSLRKTILGIDTKFQVSMCLWLFIKCDYKHNHKTSTFKEIKLEENMNMIVMPAQ